MTDRSEMESVKILWPVFDNEGNLIIPDHSNDACLKFFPDGHIESNGGRVEHHEITEDEIELLDPENQIFVRDFLDGVFG